MRRICAAAVLWVTLPAMASAQQPFTMGQVTAAPGMTESGVIRIAPRAGDASRKFCEGGSIGGRSSRLPPASSRQSSTRSFESRIFWRIGSIRLGGTNRFSASAPP